MGQRRTRNRNAIARRRCDLTGGRGNYFRARPAYPGAASRFFNRYNSHAKVIMEAAILVVRILLSILLYVFLAALFIFLWRDLRATSQQPAMLAARERPGRLRIVKGSDGLQAGSVITLSPFTTLGRSDANTIKVNDTYASAEHALIAWRGGQWWLEDRGSRNGTLLNEVPVEEALIVSHGDVIGIGQLRFKFEYATEE